MKKVIILLLIMSCVCLCLFACNKKENPPETVVIRFVTGCSITVGPYVVDRDGNLTDVDGNLTLFPDAVIMQRAGYQFLRWYYDQVFEYEFKPETEKFSQDITLYARWLKLHTPDEPGEPPDELTNKDGFILAREGSEYTVTGYSGIKTELAVPSVMGIYPITKIAANAFRDNKSVQKITVPENIQSIGIEAFFGCTALKEIKVANGNYNYSDVDGVLYNKIKTHILCVPAGWTIQNFTIGKNIEGIKENAFYGAKPVVEIAADGKYSIIDEYAFAGFLGKITLTNQTEEIRKYAFFEAACQIVFADSFEITTFTNGAFDSYKGAQLIIPPSVTDISYHAFMNCTAVIDFSESGLTVLGVSAFASYAGTALVIPKQISEINKNAFYQCAAKISFEEDSALTVIGQQAFSNFLGEVTFKSGITRVEKYAFYCAGSSAKITFSQTQNSIAFETQVFYGSRATVYYD